MEFLARLLDRHAAPREAVHPRGVAAYESQAMGHENGAPAEVAQYGMDRLAGRESVRPIAEDNAPKGQVENEIEAPQPVGNLRATWLAEQRRSHRSAGMNDPGELEPSRQTSDGERDRLKLWTRAVTQGSADRPLALRQELAQPALLAPIPPEPQVRETQRERTTLGIEPPHRSEGVTHVPPIRSRAEDVPRPMNTSAAYEAIRPRTDSSSREIGRRQQPQVEPPIVTVSIGTIEIRTSGKPDSPPARQQTGSRMMTLDEYLAKRERA